MTKLDTDRDGKINEAEYVGYMLPWTLASGVPAEWHPHGNKIDKLLRSSR